MKAIVNSKTLATGLKKTSTVIKKITTLPILSCVLIKFNKKQLTLEATDLETTVRLKIECDCKEPFDVVIPFNDILKICVEEGDQPLTIDENEKGIVIKSNSSVYKLAKIKDAVETFPNTHDSEYDVVVDVDEEFISAVSYAAICRDEEGLRPSIEGVSLKFSPGQVAIAATNTIIAYRNILKIKNKKTATVLVYNKFIQLVKQLSGGKLSVGDKFIKMEVDGMVIVSLLINAKFLPLDDVIPKEPLFNLKTDRKELLSAIDKLFITAPITAPTIALMFNGNTLNMESKSDEKEGYYKMSNVESSVDIEKIGLNYGLFHKVLNTVDSDDIELSITHESKMVLLRPAGNENVLAFIMPSVLN